VLENIVIKKSSNVVVGQLDMDMDTIVDKYVDYPMSLLTLNNIIPLPGRASQRRNENLLESGEWIVLLVHNLFNQGVQK